MREGRLRWHRQRLAPRPSGGVLDKGSKQVYATLDVTILLESVAIAEGKGGPLGSESMAMSRDQLDSGRVVLHEGLK